MEITFLIFIEYNVYGIERTECHAFRGKMCATGLDIDKIITTYDIDTHSCKYPQTYYTSCTVVGNTFVYHSDVVGAAPTATTTSSFLT